MSKVASPCAAKPAEIAADEAEPEVKAEAAEADEATPPVDSQDRKLAEAQETSESPPHPGTREVAIHDDKEFEALQALGALAGVRSLEDATQEFLEPTRESKLTSRNRKRLLAKARALDMKGLHGQLHSLCNYSP